MSHIRTEATQMVIQTNGVDGLKVKETGVLAAGAAGVSGLDVATVGQTIGVGQTWQDVTGSRVLGSTYTNNTGKPIAVHALCAISTANASLVLTVDGIALQGSTTGAGGYGSSVSGIVPNGVSYSLNNNAGVGSGLAVRELR